MSIAAPAPPGGARDTMVASTPATGAAHEALRRGTRFLIGLTAQAPLTEPWPEGRMGVVRSRFVGNCLGELDRFLHVLMDDMAPTMGTAATPTQRNTANKIGRIAAARHGLAADQARLRALGRSRACLSRCQGLVRRADVRGGAWMTAGWRAPASTALRRYRVGDRLTPTSADLADVAVFYHRLAERLIADARRRAA